MPKLPNRLRLLTTRRRGTVEHGSLPDNYSAYMNLKTVDHLWSMNTLLGLAQLMCCGAAASRFM